MFFSGDLTDVRINDYNFHDDVVRYDVPFNNITGEKYIHDLFVHNVICPPPYCMIQETDVSEWISNAVLIYGNYTVQGKTTIENMRVYGDLMSFGPVNGKPFDQDTILLKDVDQIVGGSVSIKNKYPEENRIVPVFFENLTVKNLNGYSVENFFDHMVYRDAPSTETVNYVEFYEPLHVKQLNTNGNRLFGVELRKEMEKYESYGDLSEYKKQFNVLENVGSYLERAVTRPAYYLSHLKLRKGIIGSFSDILPVKFVKDMTHLAAFDHNDVNLSVQFYRFDVAENRFVIDHFMPPLKSSESGERILNVESIHLNNMDYLVLETKNDQNYIQTSLGYFNEDGFQRIWRLNTTHPTRTTSLRLSGKDCVIRYSDLIGNSEISCLGRNGLFPYQKLEGAPIAQVVTLGDGESQSIVILTADGNVVIYEPQTIKDLDKLTLKQILQPINPSFVQSVTYNEYAYVAVCSDKTENAAHYGSIEIYRARAGHEFTHFQTINIKIPLKIQFSKLESNDLLMYVLTNNPSQSIIVYQYTGAAGFKEFISSSTIPRGKGISLVSMPEHHKDILAIITEKDVMFVEAILKK